MHRMLIGLMVLVAGPAGAHSTLLQPQWTEPEMIDLQKGMAPPGYKLRLPKLTPEQIEAMKNYKPSPYCFMYGLTLHGTMGYKIYDC